MPPFPFPECLLPVPVMPLSTGLKRPFFSPVFYATKLLKKFELCKCFFRKLHFRNRKL